MPADASGKPGRDCPLCPRLEAFRADWRGREPSWFNAPVDSFGPKTAPLLIVGLPPENKPTPAEIKTCRTFLEATLAEMRNLRAIVTLGRIAHDSTIAALKHR